ncbi:MAG TPA: hypothetical protein VN947_22080 [Polyangia bacterium]|nr:hypothetical protein [Polyangia bacterium]
MAFREKTAWVTLLTYLGAYGYYFWTVFRAGPDHPFGARLIGVIALLVLIIVVCNIGLALWKPDEARLAADERERLIGLKASAAAFHVASAGAITAAGAVAVGIPAFWVVNGLLAVVALAEILRQGLIVARYRLDA